MQSSALLKLMYLVSPALPVGAYAYSQGQEYAVDAGWIKNVEDLEEWVLGVMENAITHLDLPCLLRLYHAWGKNDINAIHYWNQYLLASRETAELLLEDEQIGQALARLIEKISDEEGMENLSSLNMTGETGNVKVETKQARLFEVFPSLNTHSQSDVSYITLFAYCGVLWSIPENELMMGFTSAWLENQIAAATKTIPLGQSQAQKAILHLHEHIPRVVEKSLALGDDDIGLSLPGLTISSCKHERQYSRLFRS